MTLSHARYYEWMFDPSWRSRWRRRRQCLHPQWDQGGLTDFLTGKHEYICAACGKTVIRRIPPIEGWYR